MNGGTGTGGAVEQRHSISSSTLYKDVNINKAKETPQGESGGGRKVIKVAGH